MRIRTIESLIDLAQHDENIYLLIGDLGFSVVEEFQKKFPKRFINVGIAEQNMIGVAAGLAMMGKKVFVYSIIPFLMMRCLEQIRVDLCYQNLPVRLIGVGAGFSYGKLGVTHYATEDIAVMNALPNMTVLSPASRFEVAELMKQANDLFGPVYFRLSKSEEFTRYPKNAKVLLGRFIEVIPSDENIIFTTGDMLHFGFEICKRLRSSGISMGLVSVHTVKPLDHEFLLSKQHTLKGIFTVEEHFLIGGLGQTITSFVAQHFKKKVLCKTFGLKDAYSKIIGSRAYMQKKVGLTIEHMSNEIIHAL
jgi:transketolase